MNAVLELGCVCTVDPATRGRTLAEGWSIAELKTPKHIRVPVPAQQWGKLLHCFLFHWQESLFCLWLDH